MIKVEKTNMGYWLKRFFQEYLPSNRNLSPNTLSSYRDAWCQLLEYMKDRNIGIESLNVESITNNLVIDFLNYLENSRNCSITTRNQRLAAFHSLAKYIAQSEPQYIFWAQKIISIPHKKSSPRIVNGKVAPKIMYLEKNEMKAILNSPDRHTDQGSRDYVLLMFMYNTGARASEVADLKIKDLNIGDKSSIQHAIIHGKGGKTRTCPLWDSTSNLLKPYINRNVEEHVFLNRYNEPITRYGIYELVVRYANKASEKVPSINNKNVSPHTIRHTTASHLLEAGVDINTIRAWLGHVSINTTNIYAEVNIRMKAEALKTCEVTTKKTSMTWQKDKSLLTFLKSL